VTPGVKYLTFNVTLRGHFDSWS